MHRAVNSIFLLYLVMAIPSYELLLDLVYGDRYYAQMMHTSGVISVYLLVLTMAVTPIALLLKRVPSGIALARWLLARRRYFGLGSFYYTALHLIHYIRQINDIENMLYEALDFELAIAWIAFLIFTAIAITSNDASVGRLKANWKKLHQYIYPAAALTFLHWYLFDFFPDDVLTWAIILAALKLGHWGYNAYRKRDGLHTSAGLIKTPPR